MRETAEDLDWLQDVLDASYASAGAHLREIHTGPARLTAAQVVEVLQGMQVVVVATVTADGRPLTGPVDGFLHRGRFAFGTAPGAVRTSHLARSPAISLTHVRGETLVVTVHGTARPADLAEGDRDLRDLLADHYGPAWGEWGAGSPYFIVEPTRMLAADMRVHAAGQPG